jgi:NRPS condensation-like uncharacterized protein
MQTSPDKDFREITEKRALLAKLLETEVIPASLGQQGLWIEAQLEPEGAAYNIPIGLRLKGPLRRDLLQRSLRAIVERHDSLRTTFELRGEVLFQNITDSPRFHLQIEDLSDCPEAKLEAEAYARALASAAATLDLSLGPLCRAALLILRPDDHILICTMHHIISDAWSTGIFIRELAANYDALSKDIEYRPESLQFQFGDFAIWQRQHSRTGIFQQQLDYWNKKLAGAPPVLNLPSDRPRPVERTSKSGRWTIGIDPALAGRLDTIAKSNGATFFILMLAAFNVLLYRYTGQTDILLGVPVAGRNHVETEALIGFFVKTLVLRTDLSGNPKFMTVLEQVRDSMVQALANQDVPVERLVQELQPVRSVSYNPLFQVMFTKFRGATAPTSFGPLAASRYSVGTATTRLDLTASLIQGAEGRWCIQADYSSALFDHDRVMRLLGHYQQLLYSVANG